MLSEIGEKNKITVTDDEVSRAVIERARQMPGREKEVWDYYRNNANALAQLRAPIYEDKVVDFILELANVTEKKVSREDLFKDDDAEKTRRLIDSGSLSVKDERRKRHGGGMRRYAVRLRISLNSSNSARNCPALSPGNWLISVSSVLEVLHHGTFVRARQIQPACRWMFAPPTFG